MTHKHHIIRMCHYTENKNGFPLGNLIGDAESHFQNSETFVWMEFTNDCSGKSVDAWLDWANDRSYHSIGIIVNIGMKKPIDNQWHRVPVIIVDNTLQALLFYHQVNGQKFNTEMLELNKKILFLTGKPLSSNRLPVLDLLDRGSFRDRITASLFWNDTLYTRAKNITKLSQDRIKELVERYAGSPDKAQISNEQSSIGDFHMAGVPYDCTLYKKHQLSIVPETRSEYSWEFNYCSEKTYRTILNCHPFIILGQPGTLLHLTQRGYDCFQELLPYPEYDQLDITTPEKLNINWSKIENNCEALINADQSIVWSKCQSNHNRLLKENEEMLLSVHRATENQIRYDARSYDNFSWGKQPDNWVWPSWNTARRKFK
jgi:hypothetical protein